MKKRTAAIKFGFGVLKFWFIPIIWPFLRIREARKNIKQAVKDASPPVKELGKNRDPWSENAPDMSDFDQVLIHWDIQKHEVQGVINGMKLQRLLFSLLGLYGGYLVTGGLYLKMNGIPMIAVAITYFIVRTWRIQILTNRQFVYFKDWFCWGLFAWVGKETPFARKARLETEIYHE